MQLGRRTRVLVADDQPSVRENLRYLINAESDMTCVGVAKDGSQCILLCSDLQPDVVILDNELPVIDGLVVAHTLERIHPHIRVIVYTLDADVCSVAQSLGAVACVSKEAPYAAVLMAIRHSVSMGVPIG